MIAYRPATATDMPQILALLEDIMRHHGVQPPQREPLTQTVASILAADDHLILVADEQTRLVGMCALIFSLSTWSASPVCELQDMVVASDHRLEDVGRRLIESAESIARDRGCSRMFLLAEYWNLDAHAFYRRLVLSEKTCLYFERDLAGP